MNLLQLKSLAAILESGSFAAAATKIGRSHSAISLQMKSLEREFANPIFNRNTRPPTLTPSGKRAALLALKTLAMIDDVILIGSGKLSMDSIKLGVVPTTLQNIVPNILGWLNSNHPSLQVSVKSGMSNELTSKVLSGEIDMAVITAPNAAISGLTIKTLTREALFVISSDISSGTDDAKILSENPFIAFSAKTFMGKQISDRLINRGIKVNEVMEVDSLDTIERLVKDGFGVSIVPQRFRAQSLDNSLNTIAFCNPQEYRELAVIYRNEQNNSKPVQLVNLALDSL